ncbi:hypothetical protein [Marinomonas ostreistagni]|uniref:hypothetical protein n=1 Tax=Marinomonas ostreistagni TaxID=359209 RepID=UPI0019525D96|nr:hypothetical protein [Marinomonas ostreistagni]MBM6551534.1 hypothetical protein [Marinomonas ostreistagni]
MDNPLAAIQLGKELLGIDDASYTRLLEDMFGKADVVTLTSKEQSELLSRFHLLGYRPKQITSTVPQSASPVMVVSK